MMTKLKSSKRMRFKILFILPVALFLISLFAFSGNKVKSGSSISEGKIEDILNPQIKQDTPVFFIVEEMPDFQGKGIEGFREWVAQNLRYPGSAAKDSIAGRVYVQFVVNSDGHVDRVKVARGVNPDLDQEAVRVVKSSPKWAPGKQRGKVVNVAYTIPIIFSLDDVAKVKEEIPIDMNFSITEDNFVKIKANDILFIVDGKQVKDSIQIPVDEFKTIEVLKGEEAIEKYGEKARSGVIIIIKKDK